MTKILLALHVLAAILTVGPVAVAASMFPATLRRASRDRVGTRSSLRILHRICKVYAGVGIAVPVFGFATASSLGVLGDAWLITSIVLTAAAAGVLILLVLPGQDRALTDEVSPAEAPATTTPSHQLAIATGIFNVLWATVTVLMIIRPGSTTGA
ncbi:hypothetical protein DWB77_00234 [Streptomyces hundungensis]|uniref:DUF2269 family protein n=1 Tax=Streptomyces hundungensis TaxID=1077946 RepID=A0A387HBI1_9ACTN|nr:DUF2269 family protein [Streptomyces hundungensis]AYG78127.1 hypothetical protein DWB77_00234 [Streptomyces hundungensis]